MPLAEAREKARQHRALVKQGVDPIASRRAAASAASAERQAQKTFSEVAAQYIAQHEKSWNDLVRCRLLQQGRALVQRAHARAAELRQPMTRLVAAWQEALHRPGRVSLRTRSALRQGIRPRQPALGYYGVC